MIIRFTIGAKADLLETLRFIDRQGAKRGKGFRDELRKCLQPIKASPLSWPRVYHKVRIRIMKKFKFGIYYEFFEDEDLIHVGAFKHLKQKTSSWKRRFKKPKK